MTQNRFAQDVILGKTLKSTILLISRKNEPVIYEGRFSTFNCMPICISCKITESIKMAFEFEVESMQENKRYS